MEKTVGSRPGGVMFSGDSSLSRVMRGLVVLLLIVVVSTLWFVVVEDGYSPLEALYMSVITLSTVGFNEVEKLDDSGRVFVILMIVSGLAVMTYTLGGVGRIIVEGSLTRYVGRRRMVHGIERLSGHYVVCGHGRMGEILCQELMNEGVPFVAVEGDEELAEKLAESGYMVVAGDATDDEVLDRAGITRARGLVAVVSSNVDNLYITMSARELCRDSNPGLYILTRATDALAGRKISRAGADRVISPYTIGGMRMVQALLRPSVYDFMDIATQSGGLELMFEEITVRPGTRLDGVALGDADVRSAYNIIVIAIKRAAGDMAFNPGPGTVVAGGDVLIALGDKDQLQRLLGSL
jgi:voltage-gated potassium channel